MATRVNFAGWLERFAPISFALSSAVAVALYACRRTGGPVHLMWIGLLVGLVVAAYVAWRQTRINWYRTADARVLLEYTLGLDARLSAAAEGVASWPTRRELPLIVRSRSRAASGWLLAAAGLLAIGAWAPLINGGDPLRRPVEKPPALAQTEAMLQALAELEVVDPASLAQLAAEVRELSNRSPEEQYSHSALEAADTLREQVMTAVNTLAQGYNSASGALAPFEGQPAAVGDERLPGASAQLGAALDGLRTGRLAGHPDLTSLLKDAKNSLGRLSAEQIKQLRSRLNSASSQAGGVAGAAGPGARIAQFGEEAGKGEGSGGEGGISRGRGDAPLTMNEMPSEKNDGKLTAISNEDFARLQLGDLTGIELGGAPQVDTTKTNPAGSAGTTAAPARGGDAVWIDRLSPADRAALKEIFK